MPLKIIGLNHNTAPIELRERVVFSGEDVSRALRGVVALPGEVRHLAKVQVAPLDDGYVLSFIFGRLSERETGEARQIITLLRPTEGAATDVALRHTLIVDQLLEHGPPAWVRHRGFILSPLMQTLHDVAWAAIGGASRDRRPSDSFAYPPPWSIRGWALLVAALAAAGTAWLVRRRRLDRPQRRCWIFTAFLTGLPGLLSCLFLTPRRESRDGDSPC